MKRSTLSVLVATVLLAGLPSPSVAATEIQFWHAMTAVAGERVNDMAAKFNTSQSDFVVKAVHKGSYAETLPAAIAAYQAKQPPHIVQVADRGTQRMLSSGAVYPVYQLMKDNAIALDWNDLIGPLKSYYSTGGNLYSMAFNSSTPILYYNKDHFKKAGLPDKAPTTWDEVEAMAKNLKAAGVTCPFGSAWPSWVLVENMHAYHDQPFADHSNKMNAGKTTPNSQGHRLGNSIAIRDAIEEQMEHIFNGNKTPKQGLDDAVAKGNEILKEFAALNK
jgi:sn-glycerol 3-phosphate transport system substrate-binding protein